MRPISWITRGAALAAYVAAAITSVWYAAKFIRRTSIVLPNGTRIHCLFDDAMISMRYAWNFAHGDGLVFNPGERVEGYTNPLWVLVMSIPARFLPLSQACHVMQWIGGVLLLVAAAFVARTTFLLASASRGSEKEATTVDLAHVLAVIAFAATLTYYPLVYWSLMGMETSLVAALLAILASLVVARPNEAEPSSRERRRWVLASVVAGGCYLTRPDAAIPALVLLSLFGLRRIVRAIRARREASASVGLARLGWRQVVADLLRVLAPFAVIAGAHVAFRLAYYGELAPNTYVLKLSGVPLDVRLSNGWAFLLPFLEDTYLVWALALAAVPRVAGGVLGGSASDRLALVLASVLVAAYQVYVGGDPWTYYRIPAPALPLLYAVILGRLGELGFQLRDPFGASPRWASARSKARAIVPVVVALGAAGLVAFLVLRANEPYEKEARRVKPYLVESNRSNVLSALFLADVLDPEARIAVTWAGAVPYYTQLYTSDILGKTDPWVARRDPDLSGHSGWNGMSSVPGHNKYDLEHTITELQPDYTQDLAWGTQSVPPEVRRRYVSTSVGYFLRGSPHVDWERVTPKVSRKTRKPSDLVAISHSGEIRGTHAANLVVQKRVIVPLFAPLNARTTWHSEEKTPNKWVSLEIQFAEPQSLATLFTYTGHSGYFSTARTIQIECAPAQEGPFDFVIRQAVGATSSIDFPPIECKRLKLAFQVLDGGAVAVRGLRFFDADGEEILDPASVPDEPFSEVYRPRGALDSGEVPAERDFPSGFTGKLEAG